MTTQERRYEAQIAKLYCIIAVNDELLNIRSDSRYDNKEKTLLMASLYGLETYLQNDDTFMNWNFYNDDNGYTYWLTDDNIKQLQDGRILVNKYMDYLNDVDLNVVFSLSEKLNDLFVRKLLELY